MFATYFSFDSEDTFSNQIVEMSVAKNSLFSWSFPHQDDQNNFIRVQAIFKGLSPYSWIAEMI